MSSDPSSDPGPAATASPPFGAPDLSTETFRDYRAPQHDGEMFADPAFSDSGRLLAANVDGATGLDGFWQELRTSARARMIADAVTYTSSYRQVDGVLGQPDTPILMAGHQPALFHAGVWFKNFALDQLARLHSAVAVNLIVDNDVARSHSIRVPTRDDDSQLVRAIAVPYDRGPAGVPYEQTTIRDRDCFDNFDNAVCRAAGRLVAQPSVIPLWEHARAAVERCGVAGCALAQARHALEGELGLQTLELPLGVLCRSPEFSSFVVRILSRLDHFQASYNEAVNRYRTVHRIRSHAHPVPNLGRQDDWFESPLWLYGDRSPQRRAVWVRRTGRRLVLSDRAERQLELDLNDELAAEQLTAAASSDFKLRPRALLTTMYARLVLSDLFLHGIGGGKYDQLGDNIVRSFFGFEPPHFAVISATVLWPGCTEVSGDVDVNDLRQRIRATQYHPEQFAEAAPLDPSLIERKAMLLDKIPPRGQRAAWHQEITAVNEQMSSALEGFRYRLRQQLAAARAQLASQRVLASREHPFCLLPLDYLAARFEAMLKAGG